MVMFGQNYKILSCIHYCNFFKKADEDDSRNTKIHFEKCWKPQENHISHPYLWLLMIG